MHPQRPVYWYSGQFLEPQHFQQADAHNTAARFSLLEASRPYFWGAGGLELDEAALAEGRISVRSARLLFQDGTEAVVASTPEMGNALLPGRSFQEDWTDRHAPLTVHAGLTRMNPVGNVSGIASCTRDGGKLVGCAAESLPQTPGRYVAPDTDDLLPDRYALPHAAESRSDAPVRTLYLYPRLFWDSELENRPDWLFLPLFRIVDDGTGPRLDPRYAPPSLRVVDSPALERLARGLEARLTGIVRRLSPPPSPDAPATAGHLLRMNASRTLSELRYALGWASPWAVFGLLRHGIAAMAACTDTSLLDALPPYRHDDPAESFRSLDRLLNTILRGTLPEPAAVVRFQARGGLLCADLPERSAGRTPLIVLQSDEPAATLIREGRLVADTPDALPHTLAHAVAGLPLREIPAPPGMPSRERVRYVRPDTRSACWQAVLRTGTLAVALFPTRETSAVPDGPSPRWEGPQDGMPLPEPWADTGTPEESIRQATASEALAKRLRLLFLRS